MIIGYKQKIDTNRFNENERCSICLCSITDKKTLDKCGHSFCAKCIQAAFKHQKKCPVCYQVYGPLIGNQPPGKMFVIHTLISLSGYESCGSITITYKFEDGVQGQEILILARNTLGRYDMHIFLTTKKGTRFSDSYRKRLIRNLRSQSDDRQSLGLLMSLLGMIFTTKLDELEGRRGMTTSQLHLIKSYWEYLYQFECFFKGWAKL